MGGAEFVIKKGGGMNTYSYSQISQYLACPKKYRYRYIDGWQEKETRAATIFGRVFEHALGSLFRREDPGAAFYEEWSQYRTVVLEYRKGDGWERMAQQAVRLLEQFVRDERVAVPDPLRNLQVKYIQRLSESSEFVAYIDALGRLDDKRYLLEWKTSGARYPEEPSGLFSLDQQLIAYSWITGISEVAIVVFVRKKVPEIQYLQTVITEQQREEYAALVGETIRQIESGIYLPHSGVRFPQNGCVSCACQGLCLDQPALVDRHLVRRSGGDRIDWLDELAA
jgi:CRISPR/Cas system-associated exonuclease Cas4 (RecB family)